jgi:hypothetical protein
MGVVEFPVHYRLHQENESITEMLRPSVDPETAYLSSHFGPKIEYCFTGKHLKGTANILWA